MVCCIHRFVAVVCIGLIAGSHCFAQSFNEDDLRFLTDRELLQLFDEATGKLSPVDGQVENVKNMIDGFLNNGDRMAELEMMGDPGKEIKRLLEAIRKELEKSPPNPDAIRALLEELKGLRDAAGEGGVAIPELDRIIAELEGLLPLLPALPMNPPISEGL